MDFRELENTLEFLMKGGAVPLLVLGEFFASQESKNMIIATGLLQHNFLLSFLYTVKEC